MVSTSFVIVMLIIMSLAIATTLTNAIYFRRLHLAIVKTNSNIHYFSTNAAMSSYAMWITNMVLCILFGIVFFYILYLVAKQERAGTTTTTTKTKTTHQYKLADGTVLVPCPKGVAVAPDAQVVKPVAVEPKPPAQKPNEKAAANQAAPEPKPEIPVTHYKDENGQALCRADGKPVASAAAPAPASPLAPSSFNVPQIQLEDFTPPGPAIDNQGYVVV